MSKFSITALGTRFYQYASGEYDCTATDWALVRLHVPVELSDELEWEIIDALGFHAHFSGVPGRSFRSGASFHQVGTRVLVTSFYGIDA